MLDQGQKGNEWRKCPTVVELGVGKEAHKVCRVARLDVVPLKVQ